MLSTVQHNSTNSFRFSIIKNFRSFSSINYPVFDDDSQSEQIDYHNFLFYFGKRDILFLVSIDQICQEDIYSFVLCAEKLCNNQSESKIQNYLIGEVNWNESNQKRLKVCPENMNNDK